MEWLEEVEFVNKADLKFGERLCGLLNLVSKQISNRGFGWK